MKLNFVSDLTRRKHRHHLVPPSRVETKVKGKRPTRPPDGARWGSSHRTSTWTKPITRTGPHRTPRRTIYTHVWSRTKRGTLWPCRHPTLPASDTVVRTYLVPATTPIGSGHHPNHHQQWRLAGSVGLIMSHLTQIQDLEPLSGPASGPKLLTTELDLMGGQGPHDTRIRSRHWRDRRRSRCVVN